jgi:hypothetical protein
MKKITLLLLTTITSFGAFSQHSVETTSNMHTRKLSFGLDVGANFSRLNVDDEKFANEASAPEAGNKTSFHVGAFVEIPIGGIFSLKPQVIYSRQGAEVSQKTGTTTVNYDEDLNYIYVAPAAVQITTPGGFIVESGPQLGFLLNAKQEGPAGFNGDIKNMRNKLDFLWNAGIGYMTKIGIGAHARYNHGFSNVQSTKANNNNPNGKMSNRLFQVGLMYHFGGHR